MTQTFASFVVKLSFSNHKFVVIAADEDAEEGRTLVPQIKSRVGEARALRADPKTSAAEYDALLAEASKAETIVVVVFVKRAAGKGTVALPEQQAEFVRQFPKAPAFMLAYGIEDVAQAAAARVLFGEVPARGRLPVSVPGLFEVGAGLQTKLKNNSPGAASR